MMRKRNSGLFMCGLRMFGIRDLTALAGLEKRSFANQLFEHLPFENRGGQRPLS